MASFLANDNYTTQFRGTWIIGATSIGVDRLPSNIPTIITAAPGLNNQTKFSVTGVSGDSPSNYTLTGVSVISGGSENLPEGTTAGCYDHEEFFNQYATVVNGDLITLGEQTVDPDTPASGSVIFYMKNGVPFVKDDTGTVTQIGFSSDEWVVVPDAGTMNIDLTESVKKKKYLLGPLTANRTFTLSGATNGLVFMTRIMQDGTGNRQPSWFSTGSEIITVTIANPAVVTTTFDIRTGTPVKFTTTGTLPTGLTPGTQYYWIRTSGTTGNLATSKTNAYAGTTITTSASQSGDHTMAVQIKWSEDDRPDCSSSKWDYDDFVFVVGVSPLDVTGTIVMQEA